MPIVSDTSPLIVLKKSKAIFILEEMFEKILIPPSVRDELFEKERNYFSKLEFLRVEYAEDRRLIRALTLAVDTGEAEAIALSIEKNIPLLIDDLKGRRVAEKMGIRYIGTLGLLKAAKNKGIIREIKPYILNFLKSGYYLDEVLVKKFLESVGEEL